MRILKMNLFFRVLNFFPVILLFSLLSCSTGQEEIKTSLELARLMGYGINLGNTMEACNNTNRIPGRAPGVYETMWGQPVTTQEMITGMREAGFKTLRIPVAWTNAMDFENGGFTINDAYLDRVEEIINFALNEDMFVIVNNHWDHGWWSMFGHPDPAVRSKAMEMFVSMWTQIADRYNKYDHRLIFEPANEEWGNRFNDQTPFSPTGGILTQNQCYELLNQLAQTFVDLVRDTGGNNSNRFLLIPGYDTDIVMTLDNRFRMPADRVSERLLLSIHYYTPSGYCIFGNIASWGTARNYEEQNDLLGRLTKFTEMGYGIVLGEWGVLLTDGVTVREGTYDFFENFLNNCDKYGFAPVLWDCNNLYNKSVRQIIDPVIAEYFLKRNNQIEEGRTPDEIRLLADEAMAWSYRKAQNRPEFVLPDDTAMAWIMYNSGDWSMSYSVGNSYDPNAKTAGVAAVDQIITGAGTYTVSLDFTGTNNRFANGIVFSALGIANGETLFPGYVITITEVLINGEPAQLTGRPYTTSDDGLCTRVNLYNSWVSAIPPEARDADNNFSNASPTPLVNYIENNIQTIVVTFEYTGR